MRAGLEFLYPYLLPMQPQPLPSSLSLSPTETGVTVVTAS